MITRRKLNKKLDLLIYRQNLLATVVFDTQLSQKGREKMAKRWNGIRKEIMGDKNG